jgi:phosphoglucosamine mutase
VQLFPQSLVNVRVSPGRDWHSHAALTERLAQVRAELGESGRVLIRPSGTEPVVRVMVEAREAAQAERCAQALADCLRVQP